MSNTATSRRGARRPRWRACGGRRGLLGGAALGVAIALAAAPPVPAAIPPPDGVVQPIVIPKLHDAPVGRAAFATAFDDTTATGTASGGTVALAGGARYRVRTCVWAKAAGAPPASACEQRTVDGRAWKRIASVPVPTATLRVQRPPVGLPPTTMAGLTVVETHSAGKWLPNASSWPSGGLPAAGVAVPAVDQVSGPVLGPQGFTLPGVRPGGINTGAQDSICRPEEVPARSAPEGSAGALGDLPFPYEVGAPSGRFAGRPARGVMLVVHPGGWFGVGRGALELMRGEADRWRARGWRTVNASYRGCDAALGDVTALYDRAQRKLGGGRPICALGHSSGGHLALLLATRRPQLDCVVAAGAIADLPALPGQSAARQPGAKRGAGPGATANWAVAAFGADGLAAASPARLRVRARVLYGIAATDDLVPWAQATEFARAQRARNPRAYVDTERLRGGREPFVHGTVSGAALQRFHDRERALVAPLVAGRRVSR